MKLAGIGGLISGRRHWLLNWALALAGLLAAQGSSALSQILVARRAEPTEYGRYLACYALASMLVVLPGWGLDRWLLAKGGVGESGPAGLWRVAGRSRLWALGLWLAAMALFASLNTSDAVPPGLLVLTSTGVACDSVAALVYAALRCEGNHQRVVALQAVSAVLLVGLAIMLPSGPDLITNFAVGRMLIALGVAIASYALAARRYGSNSLGSLSGAAVGGETTGYLRQALPFAISEIALSVYKRVDLSIVSLALGAVGASLYGPALNLVNMSFLVPFAFNILMLPRLARAYVEDRKVFKRLSLTQLTVQALTGTLIALALAWLAEPIMDAAFGAEYHASATFLRLLSPLVALKGLSFGLGNILTAANRQGRRTTIQVGVAVFNLVANLLVIGPYGIAGVAVVYSCSELLLCSGYALMIRQGRDSSQPGTATQP